MQEHDQIAAASEEDMSVAIWPQMENIAVMSFQQKKMEDPFLERPGTSSVITAQRIFTKF